MLARTAWQARILVQRGIADQVREHLRERSQIVVGPGEGRTRRWTLIDFAAVARVDRIVEDSASYGKVIVRGGPVSDGTLAFGASTGPA